jgi:hypothetical protein
MAPVAAPTDPDFSPAVAAPEAPAFLDHDILLAAAVWTGRQISGTIAR